MSTAGDQRNPYPPGGAIVDAAELAVVREDWDAASNRVSALEGTEALLAAVAGDPDGRVRNWAARRLASEATSDPRTLPALLRALATDPAWQVRECVIKIDLENFDGDEVVAALQVACTDEEDDVVAAAEESLRRRSGRDEDHT